MSPELIGVLGLGVAGLGVIIMLLLTTTHRLGQRIDNAESRTSQSFDNLESRMEHRMDELERRQEQRLNEMEIRIDSRMNDLEKRQEQRFDKLETRLSITMMRSWQRCGNAWPTWTDCARPFSKTPSVSVRPVTRPPNTHQSTQIQPTESSPPNLAQRKEYV